MPRANGRNLAPMLAPSSPTNTYHRHWSIEKMSTPLIANGFSIKEVKRKQSQTIDQHVNDFLARGGSITPVPYGTSSLPNGRPSDIWEDEVAFAPPILPGSAPHDPERVKLRARRRAKREGRVVDAPF